MVFGAWGVVEQEGVRKKLCGKGNNLRSTVKIARASTGKRAFLKKERVRQDGEGDQRPAYLSRKGMQDGQRKCGHMERLECPGQEAVWNEESLKLSEVGSDRIQV